MESTAVSIYLSSGRLYLILDTVKQMTSKKTAKVVKVMAAILPYSHNLTANGSVSVKVLCVFA